MSPLTRADAALILLIVICLPLLYWHFWSTGEGHFLQISSHGQKTRILSLEDQTITISGPLGETQIEVIDGKARFKRAPCSNQVCIRRGWIEQAGDLAACLPNQVSIQILGVDPRYDAMNF